MKRIKVKDRDELLCQIKRGIFMRGLGANLNYIDTSEITDMSELIMDMSCDIKLGIVGTIFTLWQITLTIYKKYILRKDIDVFVISPDISNWDVSNVKYMAGMFKNTKFNGDISRWNTVGAIKMDCMFRRSLFNQEIVEWNVENVRDMCDMFSGSKFNGDISKWNVSNVRDMTYMFESSQFNQDISDWDVRKVRDMTRMFSGSMFNRDISRWNIENLVRAHEIFGAGSKFNHNIFIWTTKCSEDINLRKLIPERLLVRSPINLWIEYDN